MSKPTVFISYSHLDEPWKDRLGKHLGIAQQQGLLQTWDDRKLLGGDDWFSAITKAIDQGSVAVLLVSQNSLTSNFILNEEIPRMLDRQQVQATRFYPIIVEYCDWEAVEWLKKFNLRPRDGRPIGINKDGERTEEQINRDLAEIVKEIRMLPPLQPAASQIPEPVTGECPYLGLDAFTEETQHLFFGRDDFADALFAKVKQNNFVALVGPSGCGKSSVVQAGLFPRLRRDTTVGWQTLIFQPDNDPFLNLADKIIEFRDERYSFFSAHKKAVEDLAKQLRDASAIASIINRSFAARQLDPKRSRLLLVVDQFEELFTLSAEADRQKLMEVLLAAKETAPVTVMLTLRSDFMGQAQSLSPVVSQLLDDGIVSHRPLGRADLEAIITGPAQRVGLKFEPGLVQTILDDVAAQPDSLPLLEYALKEMWHKRQGNEIGKALYESVGKVEGAISQHADTVLQKLSEAEQATAMRTLTKLVRVAIEDNESDTRLRFPQRDLSEAQRALLQTFVKERLLVTKRERDESAATIAVAHEALIRRWGKLREALDRDREFLMWRRRLDLRRKVWEQKGRDSNWLLMGGEFDDAQRWVTARRTELTEAEIEFITWMERPEYQIERVFTNVPEILLTSGEELRYDWFTTLVYCGQKEKAFWLAHQFEGTYLCAEALSSVASGLTRLGLTTEALATARQIEHLHFRSQAFISVAIGLAKAGMMVEAGKAVTEALAAARQIEFPIFRLYDLSSVAGEMPKVGMSAEAEEAATEALATARQIEEPNERLQALIIVADGLAKAGLAAEAGEAATEARAAARRIEKPYLRSQHLSSVAGILAKAGLVREVGEVVSESLAAARQIGDPDNQSKALNYLASQMMKSGLATESLAAARQIENLSFRVLFLSYVADGLAKVGLAADAREAATEALAAARQIEDPVFCSAALSYVADGLVKAGLTAEALAVAREIRNTDYRLWALSYVAGGLAKAGLAAEAGEAATEALDAARQNEVGEAAKADTLIWVVGLLLDQEKGEMVRNLVDEMRDAINKIFDNDRLRSSYLSKLAVISARLHSYRNARSYADQCSSSADRLVAYTAIVREYYIERKPSLAKLFNEMDDGNKN